MTVPPHARGAAQQPISGFADVHTHQFANLGFGGLVVWGAPFTPDGEMATALPWSDWTPGADGEVIDSGGDPVARVGCPTLGLPRCAPTSPVLQGTCPSGSGHDIFHPCPGFLVHGPGGIDDLFGNFLAGTAGHAVGGQPEFDGWPRWNNFTVWVPETRTPPKGPPLLMETRGQLGVSPGA